MDPILRALLALIAAINAATGAPADVEQMPDRPAIVAPTAQALPAVVVTVAPSQTALPVVTAISGKVIKFQDGQIVVNDQTITLGSGTQISGQLRVGVSVKVVVRVQEDGSLEASSLEVGDDSGPSVAVNPTEKPDSQTATKPEVKPTEKPQAISSGDSEKSTESTGTRPAETPEVKLSPQPTPQPTEKPEVKPAEKESGSGDSAKNGGDSGQTSSSGEKSGGDSSDSESGSGD